MSYPLLLGHRGARAVKSIPENTFASFDRALVDGCDGFELDVRLTADGVAVICHDAAVGRLKIAKSKVKDLPGLLNLNELLDRYQQAFLDIELKVMGLEKIVIEAVKSRPAERYVVSSFLPEVLTAIHAADATIPLGLICEKPGQLAPWKDLPIQYLIPQHKLVTEPLIGEVHAAGKKIFVWTVNVAAEIKRMAELNVDAIISDNPKRLKASAR